MQTDKLFYYSGSKNVLPGKGTHEFVNNADDYIELSNIKDWRKVLSNFYEFPFDYNNKKWSSVEHAFQSHKIGMVNPEIAAKFEYGGEFSGPGINARKQRKVVVLSGQTLHHWNSISNEIMQNIILEKYKQCEIFREVLRLTGCAELLHSIGYSKPERQYYLESLRLL